MNFLNSQDLHVKYTAKKENDNKKLNFSDATIRNNLNPSYYFAVYRKETIINVQIKLLTNIFRNITMGVFKEFLSCALHICSEKYLALETEFLIKVLTENNEQSITVLEKITRKIFKQYYFYKRKKINITTGKGNKIEKLPLLLKPGSKLRKEA